MTNEANNKYDSRAGNAIIIVLSNSTSGQYTGRSIG